MDSKDEPKKTADGVTSDCFCEVGERQSSQSWRFPPTGIPFAKTGSKRGPQGFLAGLQGYWSRASGRSLRNTADLVGIRR